MVNHVNLNLPCLSSELRLLLDIMKKASENENPYRKSKVFMTDIDWDLFLQLARHHRVYPTIYRKIKGQNEKCFPADVVQTLNLEYQKNTFRMLHLSAETEKLARLFSGNNIRSLFLKGPVLAFDLYGDISLRTSNDLDILIPIDDLEKMDDLLLKDGYVKDDYILTVLSDWKWRHHHVTYFHPGKKIKVEIHWRLNPGPAKEPCFSDLWEQKRISLLTKTPVHILGSEDLFFFLVSHGARHGWSRLRWLADIDKMARQKLDWDRVTLLLRKNQTSHLGGQALVLASKLFGTPDVDGMSALTKGNRSGKLAEDALFYLNRMVNLHSNPVPDDVSRYHKRHLFSLMSKRQKLFFIMSMLYPYPIDAETLPLPKRLHFLYFPLHPLLWVWRKTRKQTLT